ncbi:MAG: GT4 family glycosyltransferase PelF [Alphaproteobacteria bacterium]
MATERSRSELSGLRTSGRPDVCFILEGTYPYVAGGVSSWVHDLIRAQEHLRFALVCILATRTGLKRRYELPPNVVQVHHVFLQEQEPGAMGWWGKGAAVVKQVEPPLSRLLKDGDMEDLRSLLSILARSGVGARLLMNSRAAWRMIGRMYEATVPSSSFLDYFWSWRSLVGSVIAVLTCEVPDAGCYHAVSTGYAGLLAARTKIERKRPLILTEHGIYTNERRIEIAMADWLFQDPTRGMNIESSRRDLKDFWLDSFATFSRICYQAADRIITLYGGNQILQRRDGADPAKMRIVPNGIDFEHFSAVVRAPEPRPPTVVLIGRVVPIKDVKTFIRSIRLLRQSVPSVLALILGPTEEDETYFKECQAMVQYMELADTIKFLGRVNIAEYLGKTDVIVLTSISEAQPLVILEGGAAGIPSVTTDVGACSEMIYGQEEESPPLGEGGAVVPVANPAAIAVALTRLIKDTRHWQRCSDAIRERVRTTYNKSTVNAYYRQLYETAASTADAVPLATEGEAV